MNLQEQKIPEKHISTSSSVVRKDIFNSERLSSTVVKQDFFRKRR